MTYHVASLKPIPHIMAINNQKFTVHMDCNRHNVKEREERGEIDEEGEEKD